MPRSEVCVRVRVCEREMSAGYNRGVKVQNCKVISHGDILSRQCDWTHASMQTSCWTFFACETLASVHTLAVCTLSKTFITSSLLRVQETLHCKHAPFHYLIVSCMSCGLLCLKGVFLGAGVATGRPRAKSSAATRPLVIRANTPTDSTRTPKQAGRGVFMHPRVFFSPSFVCSLLHMA